MENYGFSELYRPDGEPEVEFPEHEHRPRVLA